MSRAILIWIGIALAGVNFLQAAAQQSASPDPPPASQYHTLLNRYCVTCHNEKLQTAGLMLDTVDVAHVSEAAEVWEKVVRKLRTREMPPPGMPRPD
ncbi:MAG: c-type cytochrome domain-containing protein [Acidobacteriota bacterium]